MDRNVKSFSNKTIRFFFHFFHVKATDKTEYLCVQIFNFCIVGVIATLIDFIYIYIFKDICHFSLILANTLSFVISVMYNYWASVTFVFHIDEGKSRKKNFLLFISFSVIGLVLNDIIVWVITDKLKVYYLISKVMATLVVMVFNFITRKKFLE